MKIVLNILRFFILIIGLFFLFWSIVFDSYYTACLIGVACIIVQPFIILKKFRLIILTLFTILLITTYKIPLMEINSKIEELAKKPRSRETINLFSASDRMGIYGLNILMSLAGLPIYPEISKETFFMIFKSEDGFRDYESDFFMESRVIKKELLSFERKLLSQNLDRPSYQYNKRIYWYPEDYVFGVDEARYALALNPTYAEFKGERQGSNWKVEIILKVQCSYPNNSYSVLINEPRLVVEEGLFWVLQEAGWLHPYTARWHHSYTLEE